jgi:hypothetical protein
MLATVVKRQRDKKDKPTLKLVIPNDNADLPHLLSGTTVGEFDSLDTPVSMQPLGRSILPHHQWISKLTLASPRKPRLEYRTRVPGLGAFPDIWV